MSVPRADIGPSANTASSSSLVILSSADSSGMSGPWASWSSSSRSWSSGALNTAVSCGARRRGDVDGGQRAASCAEPVQHCCALFRCCGTLAYGTCGRAPGFKLTDLVVATVDMRRGGRRADAGLEVELCRVRARQAEAEPAWEGALALRAGAAGPARPREELGGVGRGWADAGADGVEVGRQWGV